MSTLLMAKRQIAARSKKARQIRNGALERAVGGLAIVDASASGIIGFATPKAEALLAKYFGNSARHRLPDLLLRWALPARGKAAARPPWSFRRGAEQLCIRLTGSSDGAFQFQLEEKTDDTACLRRLGLTCREAEVLLWITRGKTSREISVILGCKTGTVSKHSERIFDKLGVETRTAAAAIATEAGI